MRRPRRPARSARFDAADYLGERNLRPIDRTAG